MLRIRVANDKDYIRIRNFYYSHALGVHPMYSGKGVAKQMVDTKDDGYII